MNKKIDVKYLKIGMYVEELDRPWEETPFLFQGIYLRTFEDIQEVQRFCKYVYVAADEENALSKPFMERKNFVKKNKNKSVKPFDLMHHNKVFYEEEVSEAKAIKLRAKELIDEMHEDIRNGKAIDVERSKEVVEDITHSVIKNSDALLWLTYLKNRDQYTALHSLNVCILSILFGGHLGLEEHFLQELGLGALLHDIGKLRVPLEILNKPDKLTANEFEIMKRHPALGVKILQVTSGLPKTVFDIVYTHHERINGKGYPRNLRSDELTRFSKIVSIVDVYDAMTSNRVYRNGRSCSEVMDFIYALRNCHFDNYLVEKFVECLGIFPVGSLVELNTGEVGVVIFHNRNQPRKPTILLILNENKSRYYPLKILNLSLLGKSQYKITQGLSAGAYDIRTEDYAKEVAFG